MKVKGKENTVKNNNKVCAILYTVTASIWMMITFMQVYEIFGGCKLSGWNLGFDISMIVVWGSLAVEYYLKYRKDKKEGASNEYIA